MFVTSPPLGKSTTFTDTPPLGYGVPNLWSFRQIKKNIITGPYQPICNNLNLHITIYFELLSFI